MLEATIEPSRWGPTVRTGLSAARALQERAAIAETRRAEAGILVCTIDTHYYAVCAPVFRFRCLVCRTRIIGELSHSQ